MALSIWGIVASHVRHCVRRRSPEIALGRSFALHLASMEPLGCRQRIQSGIVEIIAVSESRG